MFNAICVVMKPGFWTKYDCSLLQEVQHPDGKRDAEEVTKKQSEYFQRNVCVVSMST